MGIALNTGCAFGLQRGCDMDGQRRGWGGDENQCTGRDIEPQLAKQSHGKRFSPRLNHPQTELRLVHGFQDNRREACTCEENLATAPVSGLYGDDGNRFARRVFEPGNHGG